MYKYIVPYHVWLCVKRDNCNGIFCVFIYFDIIFWHHIATYHGIQTQQIRGSRKVNSISLLCILLQAQNIIERIHFTVYANQNAFILYGTIEELKSYRFELPFRVRKYTAQHSHQATDGRWYIYIPHCEPTPSELTNNNKVANRLQLYSPYKCI